MQVVALAGLAAVLLVGAASASAQGTEAQAPPSASQPEPAAAQLGELYYRLQVLQQEVQALRGAVEEQAHQLDRLTKQQQEHYIDLDRRLTALRARGVPPSAAARGAGGFPPPAPPVSPAPVSGDLARSERQAYADAYDLLTSKKYRESATAFDRLVVDFPNGQYTPNAFYWLGELHLLLEEIEKARQFFAQVVNLYPAHAKAPDALFKLGAVHDRLGDRERSLEYLNRVIEQYPNSSAAGLARAYAEE